MAYQQTYDYVTNREDLTNKLILKNDNTTKILNALQKMRVEKVTNKKHEWSGYVLKDGGANAQVENFTYLDTSTSVAPSRLYNFTQIFGKAFNISYSQLEMSELAGVKSHFQWAGDAAFMEFRKDINYALIENSATVSGGSDVPRQLIGIFGAITTNTSTPASTTSVVSESEFITSIRQCYDQTGDEAGLVCHTGSLNVVRITNYEGVGKTQFVDEATKVHNRMVNIILTNVGQVKLVTDNKVGNARMGFLNLDTWALAYARIPRLKPVAETTDGKAACWVAELTLEYLNEQANAKITGIATT